MLVDCAPGVALGLGLAVGLAVAVGLGVAVGLAVAVGLGVAVGVAVGVGVGAALTTIAPDVPVIELVTVSVAVIVWLPLVASVAPKVPAPFVRPLFAGNVPCASLLVKCRLPAYPVARLLNASSAVTVKLNAPPVVAAAGALTVRCVAAAAATLIALLTPEMELLTVSVPVIVRLPAVVNVALSVPTPFVNVLLAGNTAGPSLLVKCTVPG
jgi:hypothetical protein